MKYTILGVLAAVVLSPVVTITLGLSAGPAFLVGFVLGAGGFILGARLDDRI